ncbi:hypothetical protein GI364_17125 [Alicyclobacillus sp. SO9]|nr:hypothetical protein GI364_17125 [Alicyclobacillus sp. SO9]
MPDIGAAVPVELPLLDADVPFVMFAPVEEFVDEEVGVAETVPQPVARIPTSAAAGITRCLAEYLFIFYNLPK